jgi:hypothetical protein
MHIDNSSNIMTLNNYLHENKGLTIDYCGISNKDDFHNYEDIIEFKYKIINTKGQFSKICDFITDTRSQLNYDWYIKFRPEIKILGQINFDVLSDTAINARARIYSGPKNIKYGMSVNGEGCWKNIGCCYYSSSEQEVMLDDMMYIFHNNVVKNGGFNKIVLSEPPERETEWIHTHTWLNRNIHLNVIGLNLLFTKYNTYSGDIPNV